LWMARWVCRKALFHSLLVDSVFGGRDENVTY
jgi:hypothetical protein